MRCPARGTALLARFLNLSFLPGGAPWPSTAAISSEPPPRPAPSARPKPSRRRARTRAPCRSRGSASTPFHLGVRFNGTEDQTEALQRAIDRTAGARLPLILAPGVYRARGLVLPTGARLIGVPGATRIVATDNAPLIVARGADHILLSGITFDGSGKTLPENAGLIQLATGRGIAIRDCEVVGAGRNGIVLEGDRGRGHQHDDHRRARRRDPLARLARARRSRATPSATPATTASRCGARRPATTARRCSTTASRTPPRSPAARGRTATPSTCSAPTT